MQHRDYFEKEVRTVLCVRDLERSRNFYQQTLELVPVWDGGMEGCRFAAAGGAVELRPSGEPPVWDPAVPAARSG